MPADTATTTPLDRDDELNFADLILLLNPSGISRSMDRLTAALRGAFRVMIIALSILVPVSLLINGTDWRVLNIVPVFVMAAFMIYHIINPYFFLSWFGYGVVTQGGLPNTQVGEIIRLRFPDFKLADFFAAGGKGLKHMLDLLVVVWLFFFMWFAVLATIEVNSAPAYVLLVIFMACGAISLKWPSAQRHYRRVCVAVTMVLMIIWLWLAVMGGGAVENIIRGQYRATTGATVQATHVIDSVTPTRLTNWNDANRDGRMQSVERSVVSVPAGCYTFSASETRTRLSHDGPNGPYHELGSIMMLNGVLQNRALQIAEGEPLRVSFYPFPGTNEYPRVMNAGGYQLMHITLNPTRCP